MWRFVAALAAFFSFFSFGTGTAHAEWRRAESPHFILIGNLPESSMRQRILLLEDFDRLLRILNAGDEEPSPPKLHVYLLPGHAAMRVVQEIPPGIDGLYVASPDGILAMVDISNSEAGNHTLFHEYAHHFMAQTSSFAYPAWFREGFADYLATVQFGNRKIDIGNFEPGRVYQLQQGTWLPFDRLLADGPLGLSQDAMSGYYAESWALVHYLYSNPQRQAAMYRLLAALRQQPPAQAVQAAMGMDLAGLTREIRDYIHTGRISYRQMDRPPAADVPVTVTEMPPSASDLILYEAALRIGVPEANRAPYLAQIRTIAARWPDDPLAMRVLAHIELLYGDRAVADRLLDRLLAATPNDAELLYLKGMRWLIAAEGDDPPDDAGANARRWFGRAQHADENRFQTFYRYAESLRGEPAYLSDNTRNALLLAHQLAPQVAAITMEAGHVLIQRREYQQAIALLDPLTTEPHDLNLARAAREMVARAQAGMAGTPAAPRPAATPAS